MLNKLHWIVFCVFFVLALSVLSIVSYGLGEEKGWKKGRDAGFDEGFRGGLGLTRTTQEMLDKLKKIGPTEHEKKHLGWE